MVRSTASSPRQQRPDSPEGEFFTTADAGTYIAEQLLEPNRRANWAWWLINCRRGDRKPRYRVPFTFRDGSVAYRKIDLAAFVEAEKHRRLQAETPTGRAAEVMAAYGIGTPSGGPYGRKLDYEVHDQDDDRGPYVQLIVMDPLLVFRLSQEQAKRLAVDLTRASRR